MPADHCNIQRPDSAGLTISRNAIVRIGKVFYVFPVPCSGIVDREPHAVFA